MMKKTKIFHPFLFAAYPVIYLFSTNLDQLLLSEAIVPLVIVQLMTVVLLWLGRLIFKNLYKAAIWVSLILIFFFSYGYIFDFLRNSVLNNIIRGHHSYLFSIEGLLFIIITSLLYRSRNSFIASTKILNFTCTILILLPTISIVSYHFASLGYKNSVKQTPVSQNKSVVRNPQASLPSIYYIIFDRYASYKILKDDYHFDNSDFLDYLRNKGFYVADNSFANYTSSAHSLASSLNMQYLDDLTGVQSEESTDWKPLYEKLQNFQIWHILRQKGYQYYHFGSWWGPTGKNRYADRNFNLFFLSEFTTAIYSTTMFYPIGERIKIPYLDTRFAQFRRVLYKFDELAKIAHQMKPTFVFAHMIIPHEPFVFEADGDFLSKQNELERDVKTKYTDQLIYINKRIKQLVDQIIENSTISPIIILQADEGPYPERYEKDTANFQWSKASREELEQKMGIFNAYYFPDGDYSGIYNSITPVNTFRLVMNKYFSENYPLLEDKFFLSNMFFPYKFFQYKRQ